MRQWPGSPGTPCPATGTPAEPGQPPVLFIMAWGVAEQHQTEILGFTSHKNLFSRALLLHVLSHIFMPGCRSHCPPLADLTPQPYTMPGNTRNCGCLKTRSRRPKFRLWLQDLFSLVSWKPWRMAADPKTLGSRGWLSSA